MTIEQFQSRLGVDLPSNILNEKFVEFKAWEFEQNIQNTVDEIFSELARSYTHEIKIKREIARIKSESFN